MNHPIARTFLLTLLVAAILLGLYYLPPLAVNGHTLRRVNLLADIQTLEPDPAEADTVLLPPPPKPAFVDTCRTGMTCIEDYSDSTQRGMKPFYEALDAVQERPVRIAYFGDSFIEADILTGDLRDMLQQHYGGCGVGFVDIASGTYGFRQTVRHSFGGWSSHGVTDTTGHDRNKLGISSHYYLPRPGAFVELKAPAKPRAHLDSCQLATIFFESDTTLVLTASVNGQTPQAFAADGNGTLQTRTATGTIRRVRWEADDADGALFFGVALDGRTGISLDNFGVRSSSGLNLRSIPLARLKAFNRVRPYDLIVLQFGLNVATPRGRNYDNYERGFLTAVEHLKKAFPQAGILLVGVGDREFKDEEGNLRTMPGVKNLIRYQQNMAAKAGIAFWNLYDAMGGEGSIVHMVEAKEANLDYTHINFKGGRKLAGLLYESLVYGKEQYDKRKAYEHE